MQQIGQKMFFFISLMCLIVCALNNLFGFLLAGFLLISCCLLSFLPRWLYIVRDTSSPYSGRATRRAECWRGGDGDRVVLRLHTHAYAHTLSTCIITIISYYTHCCHCRYYYYYPYYCYYYYYCYCCQFPALVMTQWYWLVGTGFDLQIILYMHLCAANLLHGGVSLMVVSKSCLTCFSLFDVSEQFVSRLFLTLSLTSSVITSLKSYSYLFPVLIDMLNFLHA